MWYKATIPHSFTNRTGSWVYIHDGSCGPSHIHLEMNEGGEDGSDEWVPFWDPWFPGGCGPFFTAIEPGELYQETLHVGGGSRLTQPAASTRFRIVWRAWSSLDEHPRFGGPIGGDLIPLEERVSNHFTLEVVEASH